MSTITVNKSHATIDVGSNADYAIFGDDDLVLVGANSTVLATGQALLVQVAGLGDTITIGGDGQFAPDGRDDVVLFHGPGTLFELAQSRVDANANHVVATLAGYDTFGIYGYGDTVFANGAHNGLWVGQNGFGATGSALDFVNGLTDSALFEMGGSDVFVNGARYTALMNGDDMLSATGTNVTIKAVGANNVANVTGGTSGDDEVVTFANGGTVNASNANPQGAGYLDVLGDHVTLTGAVFATSLLGSGNVAVLANTLAGFTFGGNGESGALDILRTPGGAFSNTLVVANSNVRIVSSGLAVTASGHDRVVIVGNAQFDTDTVGGNVFVLSTGLGALSESNLQSVAVLHTGDVVHLLANSQLYLETTGTTSPGAIVATMGANDTLAVQGGVTVRVPVAAGKSELVFNADDRLVLAAHFTSVADLLNHTVSLGFNSLIQFDAAGDQLMLTIPKDEVGTYATQGIIKFA